MLSVAQLLRKSIRSCLSRTYFDGTELQDDELREALAERSVGLVILSTRLLRRQSREALAERSVGLVILSTRLLRRQRCAVV